MRGREREQACVSGLDGNKCCFAAVSSTANVLLSVAAGDRSLPRGHRQPTGLAAPGISLGLDLPPLFLLVSLYSGPRGSVWELWSHTERFLLLIQS